METHEAKSQLLSIYLKENPENAAILLMKSGPSRIAQLLQTVSSQDVGACVSLLPSSLLADVFGEIDDALTLQIMNQLPAHLVAAIFRQWRGEELLNKRVERLLPALDPDLARAATTLLTYPIGAIGSLMHPVPFSVPKHMTIQEVLTLLKQKRCRYSRYIYIVNEAHGLEGVVPFKDAFYAGRDLIVSQLMTSNVFSFHPEMGVKEAFKSTAWRKWDSIPVTDSKKTLIGVLRYDTLEGHMCGADTPAQEHEELYKAGHAVAEVFQIGLHATVSALGFGTKKP
jgi:magnesium transporter